MNLAAQRVKRWPSRKREPFVGYAHVALAIGQDQVIHSTVGAKGSKQPKGVAVQSIYELAPDSSMRWEVLRHIADHPALDSVRDVSSAYIGFAYNNRFDLKQLVPSIKYDFAVYCSEFIAAVFSELELIDKVLLPHKVTPNLLHDTLVRSGWMRVASDSFNFNPSPDWILSSSQHAALHFAFAKNIVGQRLSVNKLLIELLNAHCARVDTDKDGSLAIQAYVKLVSNSLVSLPVTFRASKAILQLSKMACVYDEGGVDNAATETLGATASTATFKLTQWADLALNAHMLKCYSRMIDQFFSFEANVVTDLASRAELALNATSDTKKGALKEFYYSSSAFCHYFQMSDLRHQYKELSHLFERPGHPLEAAFSFLNYIITIYVKIQSLLAIVGPVVFSDSDITPDVVKCLEEIVCAYEPLRQHISIVEKQGQLTVNVDAAVTTSNVANTMIAELRRRLANP